MSSHLLPAAEVALAYTELRTRVIDLLRARAECAETVVPHCPAWTVRETLCHMVGVNEDVLSGNMNGVTTEAWTQAQVERHRDDSLPELLELWESLAAQIDSVTPHFPEPVNHQFVFDATMHEHDIRCALGDTGARDSRAVSVAAAFVRNMLERHPHPGAARLVASSVPDFDFVRSIAGRRSLAQVAQCGLDAETVSAVVATMPVSLPATDVVE